MVDPRLLLLADGRFPAGGHAQSAGIEAAVKIGDVGDIPTLARYLAGRLATTGVTDAAFVAATVGACRHTGDATVRAASIDVLDGEYDARVLSPALRRVSRRFGRQLLRAGRAVVDERALDAPAIGITVGGHPDGPHQPIALGALTGAIGASPEQAATVSMHHLASAVVSAGVRLLGLDPFAAIAMQSEVATMIAELVAPAAAWAVAPAAALPAAGGSLTEILGEDHASWDARLFVA
jgi:urease accessory protein